MLHTLWIFFCWFAITFSFAGLIFGAAMFLHDRQRKKSVHSQLVVGPFRANLRRVR